MEASTSLLGSLKQRKWPSPGDGLGGGESRELSLAGVDMRSEQPSRRRNEGTEEMMLVQREPGEGQRGAAGEMAVAALGAAGLMWHHPGRAQGWGVRGGCEKREGTLSEREDTGGFSSKT